MKPSTKSTMGTSDAGEREQDAREVDLRDEARLPTRLLLAADSEDAKYVHGSNAEYTKIGYGTPFEGNFANRPKTSVKTTIVRNGWRIAQATPIDVCL